MSEESGFLQAMKERPDDESTPLVYADWLEERGESEATARAEFLRVQHKLKTAKRAAQLLSREAKLRSKLDPVWLSQIGDTPRRLLELWRELAGQISTESTHDISGDLANALQVTSSQGLLDIRYDSTRREWDERALALLAGREVAPVLRELRLLGDGWAANGVRDIRIDALLGGHVFTNLAVFEVEREGEDGMPWIGGLDDEQGALGRLLARAPALRVLISPSAPDATFFQVGERPIKELHIVAGLAHQDFIGNLARSSCFPALRVLIWNDANHTYRDGWSQYSTPAEDYFALFRSQAVARAEQIVLRDLYVTQEQMQQLLAIRSQGVVISCINAPYSQP
jgi:uncharacterized protein (TIGR02996 family)